MEVRTGEEPPISTPPHLHTSTLRPREHGLRASFASAGRGLWHTLRSQRNPRIHLSVALLALGLGLALRLPPGQIALVLVTIALVFLAETVNTAIETILDLLHPAHHPLVGRVKDTAAGAVLLCAAASVLVGLLVFLPPVLRLLTLREGR